MHTVDLLDQALTALRALGYRLREEWLERGTTECEIQGQPWLFIDLADSPQERLQAAADVLARETATRRLELAPPLRGLIEKRTAA